MNQNEILKGIPDKRQDTDTTSLKFKRDLIEFFEKDYQDKTCLEIGTNKGYTTRILSFLFKNVITCENDWDLLKFAEDVNKDRDNIEFLQKDVYQSDWNFEDIDVVFIDCVHDYPNVIHDIQKSLQLVKPNEELILVFDDYGLPKPPRPDGYVKEAVDQYVAEHPTFDMIKYVGEEKGSDCRPGKILKAEEGVICKYRNIPLKTFWRIVDNKLYPINEVENLGFEKLERLRIPDEYLDIREFMVMRTCHGIGDWGILSAMPRLLKEKYPDCRVYVPTKKLLRKLFGQDHNNVHVIFDNNSYVDEFVDEIDGEVFHDHYRIYDNDNTDISLVKQMLEFWQFTEEEMSDCVPEMYWTDEEKKLGDDIIHEAADDSDFACLLVSDRFGQDDKIFNSKTFQKHHEKLTVLLHQNDYPYFYWSYKPIEELGFIFDKRLDMQHMDIRIQLYIKSKAKVNVGIQCGTTQCIVRYSDCISIQRQFPIGSNIVEGEMLL